MASSSGGGTLPTTTSNVDPVQQQSTANNSNGVPQPTAPAYAAAAKKAGDRKWLCMQLHREDRNIPFNLSNRERATLLYRKLKIPKENVKSLELYNFEHIRIELCGNINPEKFKTVEAIQIRPGLKVQPMKEIKRTTRIKVCWVPLDVPDETIFDTLSIFGKIDTDSLKFLTYEVTEEEAKEPDLFELKKVRNGERALEIEIEQPIPSYVKIAGKRARIWHPNQNFTCGRCYKSFRSCPGKADRAECKRQGGTERDFEDFWSEIANRQPRRGRMTSEEEFTTSTIDIAQVPKDVKKEVLLKWLKDEGGLEIEEDQLHPTTFPHTWRLTNIASSEKMTEIVKRMNGKLFGKKQLLFLPIKLQTPKKTETAKPDAAETAQAAESERQRLAEEKKQSEKERVERERKEKEKAGADSRGSTGPAKEKGGAPAASVEEEVENQVNNSKSKTPTSSLMSNLFNAGLEKFGILNRKDVLKVNEPVVTGFKEIVPDTPAETASEVRNSSSETPRMSRRDMVRETPMNSHSSPILRAETNKSDSVSIPSDDEIFGAGLGLGPKQMLAPPSFHSQFARDLSRTEERSKSRVGRRSVTVSGRDRNKMLEMKLKTDEGVKRSGISSQSSMEPSPKKDLDEDIEGFTKTKNKERKDRRKAKKMREKEEREKEEAVAAVKLPSKGEKSKHK